MTKKLPKLPYPLEDDTKKLLKRKDVTVSGATCPMDNCGGYLTDPFIINNEPQYAYWCTKCNWWNLSSDDKPFKTRLSK